MKNRRNIIESELPPQNPFDIWMKDGKFYKSTNKGWVLIENQMEFTNSKQMFKSTATSGTIGVNKETGRASIYNDVAEQWSPLGGGVTETTWQELKDKRDTGKLTPGSLYRITDYQCTTTQENTRSAGHQFDIVLLALSEDKLAEEGWAMMHDGVDMFDDYDIYTFTFSDGVSKEYYIKIIEIPDESDPDNPYLNTRIVDIKTFIGNEVPNRQIEQYGFIIDNINKTATNAYISSAQFEELLTVKYPYNYFQNSNLSAWKVWYCLDNDKSRFAWANSGSITYGEVHSITTNGGTYNRYVGGDRIVGGIQYYAFSMSSPPFRTNYTRSEFPIIGETTYEIVGPSNAPIALESEQVISKNSEPDIIIPEGRGVIYRLIDEWNNDVGYDFKNIQLYLPIVDGEYVSDGEKTWVYTFCLYNSDEGIYEDGSLKRIEVSVDDIYAIFSNNIMVPNLQVNRYFSIPFNLLLGYYSIEHKDALTPAECNFFNCTNAIVQHVSNVYLYACKMRDYVVEVRGIYYNTKKVLTES